jgi:bifunctional non-homologous end joining protein LigD
MVEHGHETGAEWPPPIAPMLATARPLPTSGAGFGWEFKWDGARAIGRVRADGQVRLDSRNAKDLTPAFPEVAAALADAFAGRPVSVDGELVASSPATGAPDFGQLQQRLGTRPSPELLARVPVSYVVFDVLHLDGQSTTALPYLERRQLLSELGITHPRLLVPGHQVDVDPHTLLDLARTHDLEGVVGKRLDSLYRSGRSPAWIKHALRNRIEVVIGGWLPGKGNRTNQLGALLLGQPATPSAEGHRDIEFVGAVGTGWTVATARQLLQQLTELHTHASPFHAALPREYTRDARWVSPELIGDVEYRSRTSEGYLRHPSWKGLRHDKTFADL